MQINKKDNHKSRGETRMSLVTLVSLILTGIILMLFFKGCAHFDYIFLSNSDSSGSQLVAQIIEQSHYLENVDPGEGLYQGFSIHEKDLFLFFSAGVAPIRLQSKNSDNTFIFQRPTDEACINQACVCHCGAGPYWNQVKDKLSFTLLLNEPYACPTPYLTCQTFANEEAFFGNSRGNNEFYTSILEKTKEFDTNDIYYYPIPLDILLLGQTTLQGKVSRSYSVAKQAKSYVEDLTTNYEWKGGVVIGGVATITKKDKEMKPVQTILRMEKSSTEGIYGVCLHEVCFTNQPSLSLDLDKNLFSIAFSLTGLVEQQQHSVFSTLSDDCISTSVSDQEAKSCNLSIKRISPFPLTSSAFINNPVSLQDKALIPLLEFTQEKNDIWTITPQILFTNTCNNQEPIEIMHGESFKVYLPLRFKQSNVLNTTHFYVVNVTTNQEDELPVFQLLSQTPQQLCSNINQEYKLTYSLLNTLDFTIELKSDDNLDTDNILLFTGLSEQVMRTSEETE